MCDLLKKLVFSNKKNVLEEIKQQEFPLILWGGGRVAKLVLEYLEKNGIKVNAIFVDDEFYKMGQYLNGISIKRLKDIIEEYSQFNVIMGHSAYERGKELQNICKNVKFIYYITSVAYGQAEPIPYSFVKNNIREYQKTYDLLEDNESRLCMEAYLNARMNDDVTYVLDVFKHKRNYFNNGIFSINQDEVYMDLGAYTGDTIEMFLDECSGRYKYIYAFEVNDEIYDKLKKYVNETMIKNIELFHVGLGDKRESALFVENGDLSGRLSKRYDEGNVVTVNTTSIDALYKEGKFANKITFIKINFWVGTLETLKGSRKLITDHKPKIAITVGFDEQGLIDIPQYLKGILPAYKIYLRYDEGMPARLVMYAYY